MKLLECAKRGSISGQVVDDGGCRLFFLNHEGSFQGSLDELDEKDLRNLIALAHDLLNSVKLSGRTRHARGPEKQ